MLIRSSQNNAFCILVKGASHWMTLPIGSIYKNQLFGKSKRAVEITASKAADISKGMLKNDEGIACGKIIRKFFHLDKGNVKPKSDLQNKNEIIFYKDSDKFSIKTANGREKDFFLDWNRAGAKWVTLFGIRDDYKEMVSLIEIIQTYLKSSSDEEVRVRQRGFDGHYIYFQTIKKKVSDLKRVEIERRLSQAEYLNLLMDADTSRKQIRKTRYCLTYKNQYFEIDIYPFWNDKAIAEIELSDENAEIVFPKQIKVIKEVTDDDSYKNASLAKL